MSEQPLQAHPQFTIHSSSKSGLKEYRVQTWKPLHEGTKLSSAWSYFDYVVVLAFLIFQICLQTYAPLVLLVIYLGLKVNAVLWESIIALPGLGVQLETRRGIPHGPFWPAIPLRCSRNFIPIATIHDIVINEGLRRWDVRYYLAVIHQVHAVSHGEEYVRVEVPFETTQPRFAVLKEVYHGLRETLYDEYDDGAQSNEGE